MAGALAVVDVAGVGLNATDTIIRLPHFPAFNSKVEILSSHVSVGGQVASALVACAKWGLSARYVGKIGDDAAGEFQRQEMARAGIEAHFAVAKNCESQSAYILVDEETGERTVLWKRDSRLDLEPEELDREWVVRARLLHVDGHSTAAATQAAQWAHEAGIHVMADLDNLYPRADELLASVDYMISSREFPARLTGERDLFASLPAIARQFGCRVTAATLGSEGVLAWDGAAFLYSPAFAVKAVDTTGAGDIFHGAFAYGLLQGWVLPRILEFGCAAAGLNCMALGARGGIEPVSEIESLIREGPRHPVAFSQATLEVAGGRK